jgi:hypothetical protein
MRKLLTFFSVLIFLTACARDTGQTKKLKISSFSEDSSLLAAGAAVGDYLIRYNGKMVQSRDHLNLLINDTTESMVEVVILRAGKKIKFQITEGKMGVMLKEYELDHKFASDAKIIRGIDKLEWGTGMDNSFMASVYLLEKFMGNTTSYNDIICLSGYGFRLHFFEGFCPSSPDATVGYDCGSSILTDLGYEFKYYFLENELSSQLDMQPIPEAEMRKRITESIDRNFPVIAIELIELAEWGMITGYQNGGAEFLCRTYFDKTEGYEIGQKFPWLVVIIENKEDIDVDPLYPQSLTLAKELYETPSYGPYFSGINGLKKWIANLQDQSLFTGDVYEMSEKSHANWWIYVSLELARANASDFLINNIDKFGRDHTLIKELAEIYDLEVELLIENYLWLPDQFSQENSDWTEEMRFQQSKVIENLLKLEEKALQKLTEI